jgi:dTDP-4-dehydrorhamnose 3,5-epimerase
MDFQPLAIAGAYLIDPLPTSDERGMFLRTYCRNEFEQHGLDATIAQSSASFNRRKGTLRGMHYQREPHAETKVVRCSRGAVFDVILDLRRESSSYRQWQAVELSESNHRMLYIPKGVAHGFLTLSDASEVVYQISEFYHPESSDGVRWDDPAFAISWPAIPSVISDRDRGYPDFGA